MKKINSQYDLFDLIAPIAIYHWADLTYGKKATKSLKTIRNREALTVGIWEKFNLDNPHHWGNLYDLDSFADWSLETYNILFENIVKQADEHCTFGYDKWGAKFAKLSNGTIISGDSQGQYPWFEDSTTLIENYLT